MSAGARLDSLRAGVSVGAVLLCGGLMLHATEPSQTNVIERTNDTPVSSVPARFQEQQDVVQQAIEQGRREAEATAKHNADVMAARLSLIEQSLALQQKHDLEMLQSSNQSTLVVAGVLAGIGFLGMFCLVFFLMRATSRLTEATMSIVPLSRALGSGHQPNALSAGDTRLVALNPAELASVRFLSAIEQLEKRLHELEHSAQPPSPTLVTSHSNGHPKSEETAIEEAHPESAVTAPPAGQIVGEPSAQKSVLDSRRASPATLLLAKGQTFLNLDQPTEALACFEEAIRLESGNADAFVKKGAALEMLQREEEALECYDRALAADGAMTTAYLCKGGLFNRLARYQEALKCYEQALKTEKTAVAS